MHVTSDARALLFDRHILFGPVPLDLGGHLGGPRVEGVAPGAHEEAEHPGEPEHGHADHEEESELQCEAGELRRQQIEVALGESSAQRQVEPRDECADAGRDQARVPDDPIAVGGRRVEHDQHGDVADQDAVPGRQLEHCRQPRDRERHGRRHPPQRHGDREHDQDEDGAAAAVLPRHTPMTGRTAGRTGRTRSLRRCRRSAGAGSAAAPVQRSAGPPRSAASHRRTRAT